MTPNQFTHHVELVHDWPDLDETMEGIVADWAAHADEDGDSELTINAKQAAYLTTAVELIRAARASSSASSLPASVPPGGSEPMKWWLAAILAGPFTPDGTGDNDGCVRDHRGRLVADCTGFEARAEVIAYLLNRESAASRDEGSAPDEIETRLRELAKDIAWREEDDRQCGATPEEKRILSLMRELHAAYLYTIRQRRVMGVRPRDTRHDVDMGSAR